MLKLTPPRYGRADRSNVARWFWEIDRALLLLLAILIVVGLIAVAAASPAGAARYSSATEKLPGLYFFWRQVMWILVSLPVMILVSMLPKPMLTRLCLLATAGGMVALALVPFVGSEINGAKRWLDLGISRFQPSEFLKPAFVVTLAWIFTRKASFAVRAGASGATLPPNANKKTSMFLQRWQPIFAQRVKKGRWYWPRGRMARATA